MTVFFVKHSGFGSIRLALLGQVLANVTHISAIAQKTSLFILIKICKVFMS